MYFLIDPWFLTDEEAKDLLPELARPERFEAVERQIADGVTFSQLDRETQIELRRQEAQRRQETQETENDPVQLLARALAAVALKQQPAAPGSDRAERPVEAQLIQALQEAADESEQARG